MFVIRRSVSFTIYANCINLLCCISKVLLSWQRYLLLFSSETIFFIFGILIGFLSPEVHPLVENMIAVTYLSSIFKGAIDCAAIHFSTTPPRRAYVIPLFFELCPKLTTFFSFSDSHLYKMIISGSTHVS